MPYLLYCVSEDDLSFKSATFVTSLSTYNRKFEQRWNAIMDSHNPVIHHLLDEST
jgi:hypothetical protein